MADYTNSKAVKGVFPDRAIDAQEWSRVEPLLTPEQLRRRQLLAIPLVSWMPNPVTGQRYEITNDDLADQIIRAASVTEAELGMTIFPVQYQEKHPFDRQFWDSYGYIKVEHRPVASVEKFAFTPPTGTDIFAINLDWIETANLHKGQLNIIPIVPAISANYINGTVATGNSGFAYLQLISGLSWMPAIVQITYTAGFPNSMMPHIINELIGINAALEVLGVLQMTNLGTSYSLGIDGANQSFAGPGPTMYQGRIDYLIQQKAMLIKKVKNIYGLSIVSSYV